MSPFAPALAGTRPRRAWRGLVPVIAVVIGVLLAASAHSPLKVPAQTTNHNQLANLVTSEQAQLAAAGAKEQTLAASVQALTSARAQSNATVASVEHAGAALQGPVGLEPVAGPTYTVSLNDAPKNAPVEAGYPAPTPDDLVVHQQDVQAVVNAMWAGGAEAITIMGKRIIATTAVKCVGNTLLLEGQVYSPPFVVTAIGSPTQLARAVANAPDVQLFEEYVHVYGLRLVTHSARMQTLPGYDGTVQLTYATALSSDGAVTQ